MDGQAFVNRLFACLAIAFALGGLHLLLPIVDREQPFDDAHAGFVEATVDELTTKKFTSSKSGRDHITYTVSYSYTVAGEDYTGNTSCTDCPQLANTAAGRSIRLRYDIAAPASTRLDGIDYGGEVTGYFVSGLYTLLLAGLVVLVIGRAGNVRRWLGRT
jgi:hypothetical protein